MAIREKHDNYKLTADERKQIKEKVEPKEAFQAIVVEMYLEQKRSHGSVGCMDYERALTATGGGGANPRIVRPTISDFICDVEIAARRALTQSEYAVFQRLYVFQDWATGELEAEEKHYGLKVVHAIRTKVGELLISRSIYPASRYFRAKDTR